ncbi:choice-of-anchor J domain-containing protein [Winogradskyella psychrotolerans]|uniref:choice-of-anchor J domain-containing protein n=1 Tax=Winogradskyella psychrotolerans TaxID=1344585 RepID=UPI001C0752D2|nr:choice-of-anchor J domain-containing protein [Winogradskyella psychrotolerans]MBU2928077.1 choice-of-anchor J domain-containing protein [Winogradskyella psychrotolerans]
MKRIFYCLAILGITFVGCNPMDDIYDGLDSSADPIVGSETYTLVSDDYDALELAYGNFNSEDEAKTLLPGFLADKYPFWGEGSAVLVGYDLYVGSAEGVSDYTGADVYSLEILDYPQGALNAIGFYPNEDPEDFIPSILEAEYTEPTEGQVVLASYKRYTEEPVEGISNIYEADFVSAATLLDYTAVSVTGDQVWEASSYGAKMNGSDYPDYYENEDWLISSEIDLSAYENPLFQVTQILNYANESDYYNILVSTDYTGDVTTATWDTIEVSPVPAGDSWSSVTSDDYNFSAYEGETIHIAFKYESDTTIGATWEIELAVIKVAGVEGDTVNEEVYYTYTDGEWELSEGVYILSEEDFESMGLSNFGSSIPADNYLPAFLNIKYPYAQEDDALTVIYKYVSSSSGAQLRGDLYTFEAGEWTAHESTISTTLQFGFVDGIWVPDNTIRYTLAAADYTAIVTALEGTYPNATASMANYGNMDRRAGNAAEWTDAMVLEAINVVLDINDPSAAEEQKYVITLEVYNGSNTTEDFAVIKTGGVWVYQE